MDIKKTVSIILISSLAIPFAACGRIGRDADAMRNCVSEYISLFAADEYSAAKYHTEGFDYYVSEADASLDEGVIPEALRGDLLLGVCLRCASRAEIIDVGNADIDRADNTASMDVDISYIDLTDLYNDMPADYMTTEEYNAYIDGYDTFSEETLNLGFVYDTVTDTWLLTEDAARTLNAFFLADRSELIAPVVVTPDQAGEAVEQFLSGDYSVLSGEQFDLEPFRVYENVTIRGEDRSVDEAVQRFADAFIAYVNEHDHEIEYGASYPYYMTIHGSCPSQEDLYASLCTDEFYVEYYKNWLRYSLLDWNMEDAWINISILVYDTLAQAIPDCEPEEYDLNIDADSEGGEGGILTLNGDVVPVPMLALYESDHSLPSEQYIQFNLEALDSLHDNGEISQARVDALTESLYEQFEEHEAGLEADHPFNSQGVSNQAVGVFENEPVSEEDDEEEADFISGVSDPDDNGYWMYYSKKIETGIDGVAYNVGHDGINVTCYFDEPIEEDTTVYSVWWINGEQQENINESVLTGSDNRELTFVLPLDEYPESGVFELCLYLGGRDSRILYLRLVNDGRN